MRSVLVLGAERRAISLDSLDSGASAILLRLGQGPEIEARDAARARARDFIAAACEREARPAVFAQIAPISDPLSQGDLDALVTAGLDGVFLEGCEGRADVQQASVRLAVKEAEAGIPAGTLKIVALGAQTPAAVFGLGGYRGASERLLGLALDDAPLPGGDEARAAARALFTLGAAAAGVVALDTAPALWGAALSQACDAARRAGFGGLLASAPGRIAAINQAFDQA